MTLTARASSISVTPSLVLELFRVARQSIRDHLCGRRTEVPVRSDDIVAPGGSFVTLRTPDGDLRGCVGRVGEADQRLLADIASQAVAASTKDPRFPPVSLDEVEVLSFEISILARPEPIATIADVDPVRHGVLVVQGFRRGVLLPGIPGVDDAQTQVEIACRKGGIELARPFDILRFEVVKLVENEAA